MNRLLLLLCLTLLLTACATAPREDPDTPGQPDEEQDRGPDVAPDLSDVEEPEPKDEPLSRYGNPGTYEVFGRQYEVMDLEDARDFSEEGVASWYGKKFHGRRTSSGEPYDMYTLTAAHTSLPLPTYVQVTNLDNGKSVIVRVNDRGPFAHDRIIDLSYAAAERIDMLDAGTAPVRIEALSLAYDPESGPPSEGNGEQASAGADASDAQADAGQQVVANARRVAERVEDQGDPDAPSQGSANGGGLKLQVGAFSGPDNAQQLRQRLEDEGLGPVVVTEENGIHRVRLGPVADRDELDTLAARLQDNGFGDDHLVVHD